jgi:hypothetical protein
MARGDKKKPTDDKDKRVAEALALIRAYMAANSTPADLSLLAELVTDDVSCRYPSFEGRGKQAYIAHVTRTFESVDTHLHDSHVHVREGEPSDTQIAHFEDKSEPDGAVLQISVVYRWRAHLSRKWLLLACIPLFWPCVGLSCCCALRNSGRNTYRFRVEQNRLRICGISTSRRQQQ